MSTVVMSKQRFIEYLQKQLDNKDVILLTQDMSGSVSLVKKRNTKTVQFDFAADVFASKDGVGHIAFGKTPVAAFCICKAGDVTKETLEMVKKGDELYLKNKG